MTAQLGRDSGPDDRDRDRDRDASGRARNARPRDSLGRPLPRSEVTEPTIADEPTLPAAQALAAAQDLLDTGRPFHAHEVLEAAWKAAPTPERDLWQGLAQIAVGLTHALRGNARGATALLRRGSDRLDGYPSPGPHDVDVDGVTHASRALADRIEATGLTGLDAAFLRIRLRIDRSTPGVG
ncbi:MAG TPA: DUF309 domain-containing protein [Streptosporangiaceae bacterium]|nr:DUF309 domain-containing protein [Streptosporangiaceae bacterium]